MFIRECKWVRRVLWEMAAGREDQAKTERVHAHLRQCSACRVQWQAVQQTQSGLNGLRDRSVPVSQTDWRQVQALITQVPDGLPAISQKAQFASSWSRQVADRRLIWSGATAVLAFCCLLIGTAYLPHEADTSMKSKMESKKEASADRAYKPRPVTFDSIFDSRLSTSITFSGAMPNGRNTSSSTWANMARGIERKTLDKYVRAKFRKHHFYSHSAKYAGRSGRRRRRLALAALHRQMRMELLAALRVEQYQKPNPIVLTASAAGAGRVEPEYVMTTAETASPASRRFVMDSINVDAQSLGQTNVDGLAVPLAAGNQNILDNGQGNRLNNFSVPDKPNNSPTNKEIRAW